MALGLFSHLQNVWPFSVFKIDDLKLSDGLVKKLCIPEHTKQFVFAISEPKNGAVIYILCAQNLSQKSAVDAEYLIKEVCPDAVFAQVGHSLVSEDDYEEYELRDQSEVDDSVPTSAFTVLMRCFMDKSNTNKYEDIASKLVVKEIFGVGFYEHIHAAKRIALEVGSSFLLVESPFVKLARSGADPIAETAKVQNDFQGLALQRNALVPQNGGPAILSKSYRSFFVNDVQLHMVKSLSPYLASSLLNLTPSVSASKMGMASACIEPRSNYQPPAFAEPVYPLLVDLHDIFPDVPSMRPALACAQKLFIDVGRGDHVDVNQLSEVYTFQIAVEGLRIALNNAGRLPINKMWDNGSQKRQFSELTDEDKSHCLLLQVLRSQTKEFKKIVAVMDASSLAGLRKCWNIPVPAEVSDVVEELVVNQVDAEATINRERKRMLTDRPVVAVGAGAAAILGASSLSKVLPVSTVTKIVAYNAPASMKFFFTYSYKAATIALSKILGSTKVIAPGFASFGGKASTTLKAASSAPKIRAVIHGVIASAEKTSISAMRTAFYEIMRKRHIKPVGFMPWATLGCSIASCSGLLLYGDGIECVAESLPAAPSIASLGRGIQNLQRASEAVRQTGRTKMQKTIESIMYRFKSVEIQ